MKPMDPDFVTKFAAVHQPLRRPRSVSVVVPCHNEADNLAPLVEALRPILPMMAPDWEIILVDDGSRDGSAPILQRLARAPRVRVIELTRNFGKEAALSAGLAAARGEVTVTMDADLQHPPTLLPDLLAAWREGADMAYALRADRADEAAIKRLGTRWFYRLLNFGDRFTVPPDAGDFRLMDRCVVDALLALPERNRFMKGLYAWVGFRTQAVPYVPPPRLHGRSNFGSSRLMSLAFDGLTAFTTWPLRAVSVVGLVLAVAALGYALWLTASYLLWGHAISGWTTIVVGVMLLSGIQLLSLGLVAEYVGRIFEEVKGRPLYVVAKESGRGLSE